MRLDASWTATAPHKGAKSLANQLSTALDGFPVSGLDGFMWVSSKGQIRTTKQAFTAREGGGVYRVPKDAEIMTALVAGWASDVQGHFVTEGDAKGVLLAGMGWDVFGLCPDRALAAFEQAAKMGNAIGAYNAAVIRLDRAKPGDKEAAVALLNRAVELKDVKSETLLKQVRATK